MATTNGRKRLSFLCHGHRRAFRGYHDPDAGDVGEVVEIALHTERGEELAGLLDWINEVDMARNAALDRLRAEK